MENNDAMKYSWLLTYHPGEELDLSVELCFKITVDGELVTFEKGLNFFQKGEVGSRIFWIPYAISLQRL